MRINRRVVILGLLIGMVFPSGGVAEAFQQWTGAEPQDNFIYCFTGAVGTAKRDRWRDALNTSWGGRELLNGGEVSCSNAAALTVDHRSIDGSGMTLGRTTANALGSRVRVDFDSGESWHEQQSVGACYTVDFWAVAAHELGHVWGLDHQDAASPQPPSEYPTMRSELLGAYGCPPTDYLSRTLTSDDEAGAHWVKNGSYVANYSFERYYQCAPSPCSSPPGEEVFYWSLVGSWVRTYDPLNVVNGSFYMKVSGTGSILQRVRRRMCNGLGTPCSAAFTFWLNNRSGGPASVRVLVKKIATTTTTLLNTTCTGLPSSWILCSASFDRPNTSTQVYEFQIKNETSAQFWIDLVQVRDSAD